MQILLCLVIKLHYYYHHRKQTRKKEKKNSYPFLLWLVPDDATLFSDLVSDSSLRSRSCKLESLTQKRNLNGKRTLADILFKGDKKKQQWVPCLCKFCLCDSEFMQPDIKTFLLSLCINSKSCDRRWWPESETF